MKRFLYLLPILVITNEVFAQQSTEAVKSRGNVHMDILIAALITTFFLILVASLLLLKTVNLIAKKLNVSQAAPDPVAVSGAKQDKKIVLQKAKPGIWNRIMGLKPIAEEKDITIEHEFDGISELDNPTPAWFMALFYATIAFAVVYLTYFHVLGYGKLQEEEYAVEMKAAAAERSAYLLKSANNVDENSVKISSEASVISSGRAIFQKNCIVCHGDKGQGMVGPNLTDEYWLHGGKINNVFKTIKYGVPEKGMITWEKTLLPTQISDVANYVLSLKGTNPPGAKAPQGDKEL